VPHLASPCWAAGSAPSFPATTLASASNERVQHSKCAFSGSSFVAHCIAPLASILSLPPLPGGRNGHRTSLTRLCLVVPTVSSPLRLPRPSVHREVEVLQSELLVSRRECEEQAAEIETLERQVDALQELLGLTGLWSPGSGRARWANRCADRSGPLRRAGWMGCEPATLECVHAREATRKLSTISQAYARIEAFSGASQPFPSLLWFTHGVILRLVATSPVRGPGQRRAARTSRRNGNACACTLRRCMWRASSCRRRHRGPSPHPLLPQQQPSPPRRGMVPVYPPR